MVLSALIWLPILGAVLTALMPSAKGAKATAIATLSAVVGLTLWVSRQFLLTEGGFQFREVLDWLPNLGVNYTLGLDGMSLPLVGLNGLICWLLVFAQNASAGRSRLLMVLLLLTCGGVNGAFLATNAMLFVIFYELELIPLYLLIAVWGSAKKEYAATKFLIFTAVSGILILAAVLALGWLSGGEQPVFDYVQLRQQALPLPLQRILLLALLIGFGIKAPLVPLHTWLPDTYVESSSTVAMFLGGVLAKLGSYGILRFAMPLFPEAWAELSPWLALWAGVGILYGAFAAIAQKDIKRMVAYSSIGHMSYILLAAASGTALSLVGAIAQMVSHGLVLALLFYLVGLIEQKTGSRELDVLNGLLNPIRGYPTTSALLILGGMASAGIPGMVGFAAEFLIFQGSFSAYPLPTLMAIAGTGLTAVYFVILLNRTCFGKLDNNLYYPKISGLESIPSLVLAVFIVVLGLQPALLLRWSESTAQSYGSAAFLPPPVIALHPISHD